MAELAWRADALAAGQGWHGAWVRLLLRALEASAGRRRETPEARLELAAGDRRGLGGEPLRRLAALAAGRPGPLIEALRGAGPAGGAGKCDRARARGGTGLERGAAAAGGAGPRRSGTLSWRAAARR